MAEPRLDVWRAVRDELASLGCHEDRLDTPGVLVACSGGADSLSLAAALAHEAPRAGVRAGGVTVDHGLQDGSPARARATAAVLTGLGLDPVEVVHVQVVVGGEGPEGGARRARYAALDSVAQRHRAAAILLGHTLDDQAETVLLGLARGSGARSLAGMAHRSGRYRRPLLGLSREIVRAAVPDGLQPWEDPQNAEMAYARSRVRHRVLPTLEKELGPGISAALARTGELLRADADALDDLAGSARASARTTTSEPGGGEEPDTTHAYDVSALAQLPQAVRWRVLRAAALTAGSPATDLTADHVAAIDMMITRWRGQKGVDLPGAIRARRRQGVLSFDSLP